MFEAEAEFGLVEEVLLVLSVQRVDEVSEECDGGDFQGLTGLEV